MRGPAIDMFAELEAGDGGAAGAYSAKISVQNRGGRACSLTGTGTLKLVPAEGGAGLGIKQVAAVAGKPSSQVTLRPEGYAYLGVEFPTSARGGALPAQCLKGKWSFMTVTLPGSGEELDALARGEADLYSPVCGPVAVTPWYADPE
ncbi:DUF4232 domain-containing protein [Actinokineospora sp.]|uniref:DUF4232 domain-containing protein n=1 Tax=Actinokineospora sp. TaxID=1872133 RepID=UPI004037838C